MPAIGYAGGGPPRRDFGFNEAGQSEVAIRLPCHPPGEWERTPLWVLGRPGLRRRNWRWIIDHKGCECVAYWEYR